MDNEEYASLKRDLEMLKEKWRSQERREVLLSRQLLVYACIIAVRPQSGHGCASVSMQCERNHAVHPRLRPYMT